MSDVKGIAVKRKKGFYSISVVAKMFSVHQQTIRMYEKEGLITPKRSAGNTRLFSEEDVDRLEEVISLTHKLGVNLAGVEIILKLQKKIKRMQEEMNKLFTVADVEFEAESKELREGMKNHVERLVAIKNENSGQKQHSPSNVITTSTDSVAKKNKTKLCTNDEIVQLKKNLIDTSKKEVSDEMTLINDIEIEYDK